MKILFLSLLMTLLCPQLKPDFSPNFDERYEEKSVHLPSSVAVTWEGTNIDRF